MGSAGAPTRFNKGPLFKHDEEDSKEVYHIEVKPEWLSVNKVDKEFRCVCYSTTDGQNGIQLKRFLLSFVAFILDGRECIYDEVMKCGLSCQDWEQAVLSNGQKIRISDLFACKL